LTEPHSYQHAHDLLKVHEALLQDHRRNRAFFQALRKTVQPDSVVLDIGSGTGLWALAAARLGAKRVVAVERNPFLIGIIKGLAFANHLSNQIEVVAGDSRQLSLNREFDVLITETIGNVGYEEDIVPIVLDARERFVKPDGILIPRALRLVATLAHLKPRRVDLPSGLALDFSQFAALALHSPAELKRGDRLRLVSEPRTLLETDLTQIKTGPDFRNLTAHWPNFDAGAANCVAVWAEAVLTDAVEISTLQTTSWTPICYRFGPEFQQTHDLEFKLTMTAATNYWTVSARIGDETRSRSYSPAFAAAEMAARSRLDAAAFDRLKQLGLLSQHVPAN
jgi:SAM-dependent methyltransferase